MFWLYEINNYPLWTVFWNIFLLSAPFIFHFAIGKALRIGGTTTRRASVLILGLGWLLFLPNAAYVMTDVRHIDRFCPPLYYRNCVDNSWMIMFFFTYALLGWIAFTLAIRRLGKTISERLGKLSSRFFLIAVIPACALGVLLGLVDRLNSWDVLTRPLVVLGAVTEYATEWVKLKNLLLYTFFLSFLYLLGTLFIDRKNPKL